MEVNDNKENKNGGEQTVQVRRVGAEEGVVKGLFLVLNERFTGLLRRAWNRPTMEPSNSVPASVLRVMGEKQRQKIFSQMLLAIKREIPWPKP